MNFAGWILADEARLRLAIFVVVLVVLAVAERVVPFRRDAGFGRREATNLALVVVDTLVLRLAFPVLAVGAAHAMQQRGVGLFNAWDGPYAVEFALALLALDAAIYFQHRVFHAVPWLWRLHRVHHSDVRFDVTTGVRFHPFEIALSMAIKLALIALLGAPPGAVMLFEVLLSCGSLFTHADVALPPRVERVVRALVVTPTMHRVHHSIERDETDSNFSFNLSVWDRLFGSYRAEPRADPAAMPIGIHSFREPADQGLLALLAQPFRPEGVRKENRHA